MYEFNSEHGHNIELDTKTALRTSSYDHGLTIVKEPLQKKAMFKVCLNKQVFLTL